MSLIVGQYYRGNPDQKPKQWGSKSLVSSIIAERLGEWYGIAWADVLLFMPFWNPGPPVDYSSFGITPTVNSSPAFKHNGLDFDGVDDSLEFGAVDWLGSQTTDKPFSVVGIGYNAIADALVFLNGASDDPDAISNCIQFQGRANGGIIFGFWGNADPSSHRIRLIHDTLPYSRGVKLAGTYDGNKNVSGLNVYSSGQKLSPYTDALGSYNGCDPTNVLMAESFRNSDFNSFKEQNILSFAVFGIELTEYQACGLTEDFYSLFQPPTLHTYFDLAGDVISAACTDGFTFADSATKTAILQAAAVESINLSDSDENVVQFIAALVDSFTMADLPGNTAKYPVSVSDAFSVSDTTTALQKVIALVSDNVTFSDVSVVRADLTGISEDNVTFVETLIANLHAQAIASEIINLSDSVNSELLGNLLAYVTETFNMSDSTTARVDLVALITDAFNLSEAATNTLQAYTTATDGFTVSDTAFWAGITQAIASDSFTVSGSVTGLIKLFTQAAETINFSDSGSVTATYNVQVNDVVEFATAISTIAQLRAAVADGFNVTATAMEVSQLPNGKVSVSFSIKTPGADFSIKTATVVFNIK